MQGLLSGLKALSTRQRLGLAGAAAATLGLMLFLVLRAAAPAPMATLYSGLDLRDAGAMTDALDKARIPHSESPDGATIAVPRDRRAAARLLLARAGLPNGGAIGYELFDRGGGFAMSQFEQDIDETRALEGELERSIALIDGVRLVRVHLVLPRHEAFADQQRPAQASVLLTMAGPAAPDRQEVQAILNLVAAAVPGLKPHDIAVVDSRGDLLARAGQPAGSFDGAASSTDLKAAMEARLAHAVESILEPTLGIGHVRAEASVDLDFDQSRETDENYNPDQQVTRSTSTVNDVSQSTEQPGTVTVQNNLPNPGSSADGAGSKDNRQEETTNYEIGKTVREVTHDSPRIRRLSIAVLVDGPQGATARTAWQPLDPARLARIRTLAQSAVGFDAKRGDTLTVENLPFADNDAPPPAPGTTARLLSLIDPARLVQTLLLGAVALIGLLAVLRPAALRLAAAGAAAAAPTPGPRAMAGPARALGAPQGLLEGPGESPGEENMIDIANVEGQIRASSVRRIAELIERQPEESLAVIRGWMTQEAS